MQLVPRRKFKRFCPVILFHMSRKWCWDRFCDLFKITPLIVGRAGVVTPLPDSLIIYWGRTHFSESPCNHVLEAQCFIAAISPLLLFLRVSLLPRSVSTNCSVVGKQLKKTFPLEWAFVQISLCRGIDPCCLGLDLVTLHFRHRGMVHLISIHCDSTDPCEFCWLNVDGSVTVPWTASSHTVTVPRLLFLSCSVLI